MDNSAASPPAPPEIKPTGTPFQATATTPSPQENVGSPPGVQAQPAPQVPQTLITDQKAKKKSPAFKIFVALGVIIVLGVWGGVGYLYFQNQNLKNEADSAASVQPTVYPTPTPEFSPTQIQIENGSIVNNHPSGESEILVNKEDYSSTGIIGFAKVQVAYNNKKMCFESWPPATLPALYVANIDGTEVSEVSKNKKSCVWSQDDQQLFYVDSATSRENSDIYSYNLSTETETNLTQLSVSAVSGRQFEIVSLSADGSKLICKYLNSDTETSNNCEIDIETQEVTLMQLETSEQSSASPSSTPSE